jgi:hypothetical protein
MLVLAPRALRNCAPSALSAVVGRPLNFTVRARAGLAVVTHCSYTQACSLGTKRSDGPT